MAEDKNDKKKHFLKLKAFENVNNNPKAPKYSWKNFKLEEQIVIEPGTYDLDVFLNHGERKKDERGNKEEYNYLSIALVEPWKVADKDNIWLKDTKDKEGNVIDNNDLDQELDDKIPDF